MTLLPSGFGATIVLSAAIASEWSLSKRCVQIASGTERDLPASNPTWTTTNATGRAEPAALRGPDPVEAEAIRAEGFDPDNAGCQT
jgi:hypothetical protein